MPGRPSKIPSLPVFALTLALGALGPLLTGCGGGSSAGNAVVLPNLVPTTGPSSPTVPDDIRYVRDPTLLTGCATQVASFQDRPCDIIFIGDSITAYWLTTGQAVWDAQYAPRRALDFGVPGDETQNVLWRLQNMDVQRLRPKVAVILIGTNNDHDTPAAIAAGVKAVVAQTRQTFPGVKVVLVSILPNARADALMMAADALLQNEADGSAVFYLDLVPLMPPVGDSWTGLGPDRLHPNAAGYRIWDKAMEPLLPKLLAGA